MVKQIVKRDGRKRKFDPRKIEAAIYKAQIACEQDDLDLARDITQRVVEVIENRYDSKMPTVEEVQDIIEKTLIECGESDIAKAYIVYRADRNKIRERKTNLMKALHDITFQPAHQNDDKRENANINADTAMGMMLKYGSESAKRFYLNDLVKAEYAQAHINGDIHIHDLDFYALTLTCCQINLNKLFKNGFSTGNGFIREPGGIRSYASLACIAIQANQNDQHGGQSSPNFDFAMAEGVRKTYFKTFAKNIVKMLALILDVEVQYSEIKEFIREQENAHATNLTMDNAFLLERIRETLLEKYGVFEKKIFEKIVVQTIEETKDATYQAMEALVHNLNTMHSRAGAQVPFSSLNYGTDVTPEGRMVIDCLLEATLSGLGNGETPIFPIQIFKVKEGINYNPVDPNYDLFKKALFVSGRRLFPNFSFLDSPYNLKYYKQGDYNSEVAYMGCRTRVIANVYDSEQEVVSGRGNLSFTTINLPRLALKTKNIADFYKALDKMMDIVIDQMLERFRIQETKKVYNFPFLMGQGVWIGSENLKEDDSIKDVIRHGTLSMGFIGLAETLLVLTGQHHGESSEVQDLGIQIIERMRHHVDEASKKHHLNFTLLATPAEGLSGRFVKMDRRIFGNIKGITSYDFYTNSFHIPVGYEISVFDKINKEAPYHALTNAGHISYVEVDGDIAKNVQAFEKIIRTMKEAGIGYGSVNHPIDRDTVCGFNGVIDNTCPKCGRAENGVAFERIRRITGYLVGTLERFNDAKRNEVCHRVKHSLTGTSDES